MGSIATKRGDGGQTSLAGGIRVSKSSLRVETYGNVDELNSALGFARSICEDESLRESTLRIQRELFRAGSSLATPSAGPKPAVAVESALVDALTAEVHQLEAMEGMLSDWSVSGATPAGAAFDLARTICRRAERGVVRLMESGEDIQPEILPYLNRLSDLLWLFGRKIDKGSGEQSSLREMNGKTGARWSRAW
jgi:cob(I)alamin adenosyltransferase